MHLSALAYNTLQAMLLTEFDRARRVILPTDVERFREVCRALQEIASTNDLQTVGDFVALGEEAIEFQDD